MRLRTPSREKLVHLAIGRLVNVFYRKAGCMAALPRDPDFPAAEVVARWGDDRALVALPGGEVLTVGVPPHLRDRFDVGRRVVLAADGCNVSRCEAGPTLAGT
jgi:hypothetical protein